MKYFFCLLFASGPLGLSAQVSFELYPSLETAGVNIYLNDQIDPEGDISGTFRYKKTGASTWQEGFPFTYVAEKNRLSSSLFWLQPDTEYAVEAQLLDPSTPALNTTFTGTFRTRSEIDLTPSDSKLVVSPNGSGNLCTDGQPCSLSSAMQLVQAGQDIELQGGIYYVGGLNFAKSGTETAPITFRNKEGEVVIFDGSNPEPITWQPAQGVPSTFYAQLKEANANVNCVVVDDVRLFPYAKLAPDLAYLELSCILGQAVPTGISGMYRDPRPNTIIPFQAPNPYYRKLFVHLADGSNPAEHEVSISMQSTFMTIENQSFIRFHGLTFRNYGVAPARRAFFLRSCNDLVFDHCKFEHNDFNIILEGNSNRLTVQYSLFKDNTDWDTFLGKATYEPETPFICYGQLPDPFPFNDRVMETGSVFFDFGYVGRGAILRGNTFSGFMDGTKAAAPPTANIEIPYTQEHDVFDNLISGGDDGIELEGVAGNLRFFRNTLRDCGAAISLAPVRYGPVFLLRNVISDFHTTHFTDTGSATLGFNPGTPLKFQSGFGIQMGKVYCFHNTICAKGPGWSYGLEVYPAGAAMDGFVAKNNIFFAEKNLALSLRNTGQLPPLDLDYNLYQCADTLAQVFLDNGPKYFFDLPSLYAEHGIEAHGIHADPSFQDTAANNYQLKPDSPCIDHGLVIPGINETGYFGQAPDLGAFESQSSNTQAQDNNLEFASIFPNPSTGQLHLNLYAIQAGKLQLEAFDLLGRRVLTQDLSAFPGHNLWVIQSEGWPVGTYFLNMKSADKFHQLQFVKH